MDLNLLKYPKKSHRKAIKLPNENSELAEFLGVEFGDGGINNKWQVVISLNSEKDVVYSNYLQRLTKKLFNLDTVIRKRSNQKNIMVVMSSTSLVDFLITKGAVRGDKIVQNIDIPLWIKGNLEHERAFVKGLMDTDGCLFIHKHNIKERTYHNIGFCLTSFSKKLIISVAEILKKFDINPHISDKGRRIYLYNEKAVSKYLSIFGSSNPRIINKFEEWKNMERSHSGRVRRLGKTVCL